VSKNLFPSAAVEGQTDVQPANVETSPVEAKVDGEVQQSERTYTGADLEKVVKDRLTREQKKFAKEREDLQKRLSDLEQKASGKVSPNIEEDMKGRLSKYEEEKRSLAVKLDKYRQDNLRATIERALIAQDCLDPEVVRDHLLSKSLVHLDDEDNVVVENVSGSLDDLVKDYLEKKPHLRRATSQGGVGSKGPQRPAIVPTDPRLMTLEQIEGELGIPKTQGKKLFGR
jgi:hypothetical protein